MRWITESLKDEQGRYDVAYVSLFSIAASVFWVIPFLCTMSWYAFYKCQPVFNDKVQILCTYDPQPLGVAVGAVCGGFATALAALSAYMAATRVKREPREPKE